MIVLSWLDMSAGGAHQIVTAVLSIALLLTAGALIAREKIFNIYSQRLANSSDRSIAQLTTAMGAVLGILVSFSSVGAGAIGVTALASAQSSGVDSANRWLHIAHAVPLTRSQDLGDWMMGSVDLHTLVSLLAGSLPEIFVGSSISARVPDTALRYLLAAVLIVVGSKLIVDVSTQLRAKVAAAHMVPFQIRVRGCLGRRRRYGRNGKSARDTPPQSPVVEC